MIDRRMAASCAIVFGMESHGAYAEAFDAETGKARFRFCTCYWFDFSEKWGHE